MEDDVDTADFLKTILELRGYIARLLTARDSAAEKIAKEFSPHVIILDYMTSGAPAADFIRAIHIQSPRTQFVLVTARLDIAIPLATAFDIPLVTKPFDPYYLYEVIERITGSGEHVDI